MKQTIYNLFHHDILLLHQYSMYAFSMMIRPMLCAKICKFVRSSNVRDLFFIVGLSGQLDAKAGAVSGGTLTLLKTVSAATWMPVGPN